MSQRHPQFNFWKCSITFLPISLFPHSLSQWTILIGNIYSIFTLNLTLVIPYLTSLQLHKGSIHIITILKMKKLIHKKVKLLASIHTTKTNWSWDRNPLPTVNHYTFKGICPVAHFRLFRVSLDFFFTYLKELWSLSSLN